MATVDTSEPGVPAALQEAAVDADELETSAGILAIFREWADALVIAFILAMFVRVFIVELFKIPTGSMTPTLIGDRVAEVDLNQDGLADLVVVSGRRPLVFMNKGDRYEVDEDAHVTGSELDQWERDGLLKPEYDRILVNKFAYWFHNPHRGDVVVFKVPDPIWDPLKPIYIKRAVGEPGDRISFKGRLKLDGVPVEEPEFFRHQLYHSEVDRFAQGFAYQPFVRYSEDRGLAIDGVEVPKDGLFVMGDNTNSSLDSRYWGTVPLENVKGKAFMRYWPLDKLKFVR